MGGRWVMRDAARRHAKMGIIASNVIASQSMPNVDVDTPTSPLRDKNIPLDEDITDDDGRDL